MRVLQQFLGCSDCVITPYSRSDPNGRYTNNNHFLDHERITIFRFVNNHNQSLHLEYTCGRAILQRIT